MPELHTTTEPTTDDAVHVVLAATAPQEEAPSLIAAPALQSLAPRLEGLGVTGARDETLRTDAQLDGRLVPVLISGIGEAGEGEPDGEALRLAAAAAARALPRARSITFSLPGWGPRAVAEIATGFLLACYRFDRYRSEPDRETPERITITADAAADPAELRAALDEARTVCEAVWLVRDLVNTPPNDLGPEDLARIAAETAQQAGVNAHVRDEAALEREGFGGHLGVGRGSARPPRLVRLEWAPQGASAHIALVGKGITFDTGGLSLKPAASMAGMKFDMAGAAVVLGAVTAAARLQLPVRVTGWMCIAENMPSGQATRPDDIITIHGGTTVEVTNTDAEGRLVLADGLVAASAEHPDAIIDIATLTGAQLIALGERTSGIMGNEEDWSQRVAEAAASAGEPAWRMPIPEELGKVLRSGVADLVNAKPGHRNAGMLVAARFLSEFIGRTEDDAGEIPWVHIDIAGPSNNEKAAYGVTPEGATGVMVRTLVELLRRAGE